MGWDKSDWLLAGKFTILGAPVAFLTGVVLAVFPQAVVTPTPFFPPSNPIVIVVPPSAKETTVPRHAATEKPSKIAPPPAAPAPAPVPTTKAPVPVPVPTTTVPPVPTTTVPPVPTTTVPPTPEPSVAPSDTPIYDALVTEYIGRDPSFEAPGA